MTWRRIKAGSWRDTDLELVFIHEILSPLAAAEKQNGTTNVDAVARLLSTFLDEASERSNTSSGADHDDGLGGVGRQLEVGVADVNRDVDAIVLVAGAVQLVGQTKGRRVGVSVLLLLQSEQVVGGDATERVFSTNDHGRLDDGGDGNLLGLDERR